MKQLHLTRSYTQMKNVSLIMAFLLDKARVIFQRDVDEIRKL